MFLIAFEDLAERNIRDPRVVSEVSFHTSKARRADAAATFTASGGSERYVRGNPSGGGVGPPARVLPTQTRAGRPNVPLNLGLRL